MASFGAEAIDAHGRTADFPTQSMLTGLLANALGWTRSMREEHQELQNRLVYGALRLHEPTLGNFTDYQTARLQKADRAWTTRGHPAGRHGGPGTYAGSHQRWRDYHSDVRVLGVLRLRHTEQPPTLDNLARALEHPARTLFVGRKNCLPTARIFNGWVEDAPNVQTALSMVAPNHGASFRALWPESESTERAYLRTSTTDQRNWLTGLHGGQRRVCEGLLSPAERSK
ncbi:type I-E CRISPR-associated protein Cas5/CasD [Candidatus Foliamicus sp.]